MILRTIQIWLADWHMHCYHKICKQIEKEWGIERND